MFVLERDTGKPVFPVEEKSFPSSDVPGERAWPTQPIPTLPPPLVPQTLTEADLYAPTPEHFAACKKKLATLRNEGLFTPPSVNGSILYPFTGGGANWSSSTWDPDRQLLVVPVQNLAHVIRLDRVAPHEPGDVKPLHGVSFATLWWLLTGRGTGEHFRLHPSTGRTVFRNDDTPCNKPPWGRLVGVDLAHGTIAWTASTRNGVDDELGLSGYGPALSTASGLVFHAGTQRSVLRVHDADTGGLITTFALPAGLHAGPITYKLRPDGKQYVVVAPGGHIGIGSKQGGYVVAYTLPDPVPAAPQAER